MTFDTIISLVGKAASIAAWLDPEPVSKGILQDVSQAAQIAPQVIADARDAITRIRAIFGGTPNNTETQALEPKHIDAINEVHGQITSYIKLGHNPVSPIPV